MLNSIKSTVKLTTKLVRKYPNYSIVMLGSEEQLKLCVITGRHPDWSEYRIVAVGGNNYVTLSIDQMPHQAHLGYLIIFL